METFNKYTNRPDKRMAQMAGEEGVECTNRYQSETSETSARYLGSEHIKSPDVYEVISYSLSGGETSKCCFRS